MFSWLVPWLGMCRMLPGWEMQLLRDGTSFLICFKIFWNHLHCFQWITIPPKSRQFVTFIYLNIITIVTTSLPLFSKFSGHYANSIIVIIFRNGVRNLSSNPLPNCFCFILHLDRFMPFLRVYFPPSCGYIVEPIGVFSPVKATNLGEEKLWIQTSCTLLKYWPCIMPCPWWRG